MNSLNTNEHEFRLLSLKRKWSHLTSCMVFVLLLSQTSCRPSENDSDNGSNVGLAHSEKDYVDPDEIDWKNFAAVETKPKVHPIIVYKEDMVDENYGKEINDGVLDNHFKNINSYKVGKHKEISGHHKKNNQNKGFGQLKTEMVYFSTNPAQQREVNQNIDTKLDGKSNKDEIQFETIHSYNKENNKYDSGLPTEEHELNISKRLLERKYIHRHRRDVSVENGSLQKRVNLRHKRNPFYYRTSHNANQLSYYSYLSPNQPTVFVVKNIDVTKHPVKSPYYHNAYSPNIGKPHGKPIAIPNITSRFDDSDRPVWPIDVSTRRPPGPPARTLPPRRPAPPIIQYGDEDFVTTASVRPRPVVATPALETVRTQGSAFQAAATTTSRPLTSRALSACIWAISSCCNTNGKIRYECFERLGCDGVFWDLNPCADEVFSSVLKATDEYLQ